MADDTPVDLLAIAVFAWAPHLETTCEVCLEGAAEGKRVAFAFLDVDNYDEFLEPAFIKWSIFSGCIYRILHRTRLRRVRAIEHLLRTHGVTVLPTGTLPPGSQRRFCTAAGIRSADELRHFRVAGAALGMGVLSSLIFHLRDSEPDLWACRGLVDRLLISAYRSFAIAQQLIQRHRPSRILLFNGRFACCKGIEQAALLNGTGILYHEAGATCDRYYLSEASPHNVARRREMILRDWAKAGPGREPIAERFFKPGRGGVPLLESTLYKNPQKRGCSLGRGGRRRIVYFASSIHEYAAVEYGTAQSLFASQREAVEWLVSWARSTSDAELILRLHPRMAGSSQRERLWWEGLASGNVTVLSADNPVDSYALAASADRVVCYRSSMGPEATYLGKAAIAIGDALYMGLDCVYEPKTIGELEAMLVTPDLAPKPARNCLPLGYFRMASGMPFRIYQPETFKKGAFYGQPVPQYPNTLSRRLAKVLSLLHASMDRVGMFPAESSRT